MQRTCAAIHDLSCYAKSSLTVVLPTLEVLGIETCPLPTALLSSQTDGFSSYYFKDTTADIEKILEVWKTLGLGFDAIYSGFLGSSVQVALIKAFIQDQRQTQAPLTLIDPVLGDDGKLYGPITQAHVSAMQDLVTYADVITPNTTEAALLLGRPYQHKFDEACALNWAKELGVKTGANVVITSVPLQNQSVVACYAEGQTFMVPYKKLQASYPGCGDLFASLLLGFLLNKDSFQKSVDQAVAYTTMAIERTLAGGYETRHGVAVSLILADLAKR
ncbi:pyridoxamine kinase [Sphaerochaeta globosa]|uniref:pyridoxal kinase n=1 Tax=Sphaerochaeta globosa (strain ATCC BAA-1886 / DSM 22777 / Buddy) TaxID=158189 RepID=F0RTF7_SPHGB|nr:pyridoxamine kinase [Sphaerochaeta globosa]ADY13893.1 PfkB domain protein [Sphaerochaeta globosa str. Buddy]